jgi:hypothetical protein
MVCGECGIVIEGNEVIRMKYSDHGKHAAEEM